MNGDGERAGRTLGAMVDVNTANVDVLNDDVGRIEEKIRDHERRLAALEDGEPPVEPPSPPRNLTPPRILGDPVVGETLTADVGEWEGEDLSFMTIWDDNLRTVKGKNVYQIEEDVEGAMIFVTVHASNAGGSTAVNSDPVGPVRAATVTPPGTSWPDTLVVPSDPPRNAKSVTVAPGQSIIDAVAQGKEDSEILIRAGTYRVTGIVPFSRQTIRAYPGDEDKVRFEPSADGPAIRGNASDVWIHGIVFAGYRTGKQEGVIHPDSYVGGGPAWRWKVTDCTIRDGTGRGITTTTGTGPSFDEMAVIARCEIHKQGGNSGIGGSSGWNLIEDCHIADCNPTMREMYEDAGAIKVTAGRDNKPIPTARGVIIRRNKIERHGGEGIWGDWDGWGALIEDNEVNDCQGAPIILECWAYSTVRRNRGKGNAKRQLEWVQSFKCAGVAAQNVKNCLFEDNTFSVDHGNWRTHLTYQNRRGDSPQGGVGIGVFRSTDNIFRNNPGNGIDSTMYVDKPACFNEDRNASGNQTCPVLFNSAATQCRTIPASGPYPEGSLYRLQPEFDDHVGFLDPTRDDLWGSEGRTNHWAFIPRMTIGEAVLRNRWEI